MQTNVNSMWWPRGVSFVMSALVALSATFWVLKLKASGPASAAIPAVVTGATPTIDPQVLALALGGGKQAATPEAAPASSRYVLAGVVADQSKGGAALIAVDGKPAKAVRVGGTVEGNLVLQSVTARRALLGPDAQGPASVTLDLPPLTK
jgi:general secretion pathway protein C